MGTFFTSIPIRIANGHTTSCGCRISSSRENLIEKVLQENSVEYIKQYSFSDCKYKGKLYFDFALFRDGELFCLIEYDGEQHFRPVDHFGGEDSFKNTRLRDTIKDNYCINNNIKLYRLMYSLTDDEVISNIVNIIYP